METQKTVNLLNGTDNENSKFATKKWYIIDSKTTGVYSPNDEIKCLTNSLQSSVCDYSDAYILVTGNINVIVGNADTKVAVKIFAPFTEFKTEMHKTFVDEIEHINIAMPIYNLSNNSDPSDSLWQFKRDELNVNDINTVLTNDNTPSFKYKAGIIGKTVVESCRWCKQQKRRCKNSCAIKIFEQFLEIIRNAIKLNFH